MVSLPGCKITPRREAPPEEYIYHIHIYVCLYVICSCWCVGGLYFLYIVVDRYSISGSYT
jgi:hypothetical protein